MKPKASVIMSTYKWNEALALVLSGFLTQTEQDFEILIGEDAQDDTTKILIDSYQPHAAFKIRHFSHPDTGYHKTTILNRCIENIQSDVVIFIDGDCVPHERFVEYHIKLQEPGRYIAGRRVDLSQKFSEQLTPQLVREGALSNRKFSTRMSLFWDCLAGESGPFHRSYVVENKFLRSLCGLEKVDDMKGCNFSLATKDLHAVGGYDEKFEGYGREDTDLEIRLQNYGLKIKSAKNYCVQFHLWHKRLPWSENNRVRLDEVRTSKRYLPEKGINL